MAAKTLALQDVDLLIDECRDCLFPTTKIDQEPVLELTGLEVLAFIGAKVAIPIVVSFVSRSLYDKYKDINSKKDLTDAKSALNGQSALNPPPVKRDEVTKVIVAKLLGEGFSEEHAQSAAKAAYDVIEYAAR
jgi:hypothetical protein